MAALQEPTSFAWDFDNEAAHVEKHGIPFAVAIAVFGDANRIEREDVRRNYGERRWNTFGLADGVLINVTFAMRDGDARIISARPAHRKERMAYDAR